MAHFLDSLEVQLLNGSKYLYLREISEPRENSVRLVVQQAIDNPSGRPRAGHFSEHPELAGVFTHVVPIESTDACKMFELVWKKYVAYLITEEYVGSCGNDDDEIYEGKLLRAYEQSHFLSHLSRDTGGHTSAVRHYKLTCLNHLIDVASYSPPKITVLGPPGSRDKPKVN